MLSKQHITGWIKVKLNGLNAEMNGAEIFSALYRVISIRILENKARNL